MAKHLALPQFMRGDVLNNQALRAQDGGRTPTISSLADRSVAVVDGNGQPMVDEATALSALGEGLKSLGVDDEDMQREIIKSLIQKTTTDPVVLLQPYSAPGDFTAQYPQPLDPTEVLEYCEETTVYQALPEVVTPFNADHWREMDELSFDATGETYDGFFTKGACPDTIQHDGDNKTITRKYIGAQETLSYEDIQHSMAAAAIQGLAISSISTQDRRASVADAKAKEMLLMEIMVLNKWDLGLVKGNATTNPLSFDGIENYVTSANGARINADPTGTFDIEDFDNFLVAGCARPTHIFGHPKALEAIKKGYLSLGATGGSQPIMQVMVTKDGNQVVPGFVLADMIDTSIGRITLIPDFRFTTIQVQPDRFHSTVYPLRVYHNGEPIVYKSTQTPLSFKDLSPGCTAISFMIYAVTALVVKHMCAQAAFTANWPGVVGTGCTIAGGVDL